MAILTVTATALGSYSSKIVAMTVVGLDEYHVLHGLGATPHETLVQLRSAGFSVPLQLVLGSYDATVVYLRGQQGGAVGVGQADIIIRRSHSYML